MKTRNVLPQGRFFIWIALTTGLLLLVPLVAMQFTNEVNWDITDFVVMGFLLFSTGNLAAWASRGASRGRKAVIGVISLAAFLYVWAELAVGVFTNLGS